MSVARRGVLFLIAGLMLSLAGQSIAAEAPKPTVMDVGEMCGGCVKKITARLEKMPGVARIECDIEKKTVTVRPVAGQEFAAIALWDAMVEIGKTPKKLIGPSGTFTTRPKA